LSRDRDVRAAVQTALAATGQFDPNGVWLSGLPEDYGQGADDLNACSIEPVGSTERDDWDSQTAGGILILSECRLTFMCRRPDPQLRDEAAELLLDTAANALNGQSLASLTLPAWTRVTRWQWVDPAPPERRITATLSYAYIVEGWNNLDTTP
jgi:hypothetical protein